MQRWDVRSGDGRRVLTGHARRVTGLVFVLALSWPATTACEDRTAGEQRATAPPLGPPTLPTALGTLPRGRPLTAELQTDAGEILCTLDPRRTPQAAALFIGLASGRARWLDPSTGRITSRPLYRDLHFHRVVQDALVQTGCPLGDGTGHPGFRIPVEPRSDDARRLARPGALVLARYTPPPFRADPSPPPPGHLLGSQFAVTLVPMVHLDEQVTVLGDCRELDVARAIASVTDAASRPRLRRVRVR